MAKNKRKGPSAAQRNLPPLPAERKETGAKKPAKPPSHQATRETVESLVIALVLAFLFRTFQAEAFVIPTGSMAPTLMGRHKDVYCDQCGQRFKVNASSEGEDLGRLVDQAPNFRGTPRELVRQFECVGGACQNCRYTMPLTHDLPESVPETAEGVSGKASSSGDRILVNKFLYSFTDPRRWDVVVFKFPGDAKQNYIKRLVGLPNETLRIYQGDVFTKDDEGRFQILRKPPRKVLAMRQLVHDTDHDPATLFDAGWPLRWQPSDDASQWEVATEAKGKTVEQRYRLGAADDSQASWLHYEHTPADYEVWRAVRTAIADSQPAESVALPTATPQLVTDYNSYNTEVRRRALGRTNGDILPPPPNTGVHWAGDLSLEVDVRFDAAQGALLLELVEAGQRFVAEIDVATGDATLRVIAFESGDEVATIGGRGRTSIRGGRHTVRLSNFDDQLLLWVDGSLVKFEQPTTYDAAQVFGDAERVRPRTSEADPGDLAPARVGMRGSLATFDRLQVFRDIYYIADRWEPGSPVTDYQPAFGQRSRRTENGVEFATRVYGNNVLLSDIADDPTTWGAIADRKWEDFTTGDEQLFVMGDNSPASLDCRLWDGGSRGGQPGGPYLEKSLLIGKAVCVYWPHSLVSIPTPKRGLRIPIIPNLGDIRLVR